MKTYDVCIIGGGAAGLSAAASLKDEIKTCIIEKNKIPGKKIMAAGGGRCNLTNRACENRKMTLEFFQSLGLETWCDPAGWYYPYSNYGPDVAKVLTDAVAAKNAELVTDFAADKVSRRDGLFFVSDAKGRCVAAPILILAAGGKAAPQFGTTGDGYGFAKALGHKIQKVYPILTGLRCGDFQQIKGVRARGIVRLLKTVAAEDGMSEKPEDKLKQAGGEDAAETCIAEERGEIQFTADGISGICVMNLTMQITAEPGEDWKKALERYAIELDLAPDFTREELTGRSHSFGILSEKLAGSVSMDQIKGWRLPILDVKGWKDAQCTAGGVSLEEIDLETMESKLVTGLYFAGEIIDRQGPCGGFNLQNAWETGIRAAQAINRKQEK